MNERDPELDKLYREHSREEPPPALDAAILAAAHRAVDSGPRKLGAEASRPQRWWMPLAAAAAIGVVAIGIVQQMPKETAIDTTSVVPAPPPATTPAAPPSATTPAAPPPATTPAAPPSATVESKPEPAQTPAPKPAAPPPATIESKPEPAQDVGALAKKQKEADALAVRPSPAPAPKPARPEKLAEPRANNAPAQPMPFPAASVPQKTEAASAEAKRDAPMEQRAADARKDTMRDERQAPMVAGAPLAATVNRMRAQGEFAGSITQSKIVEDEMRTLARDPEAWIVRIRKLRDEGNAAQALREIKEFRALVPDAERKLPADLKALQP